MPDDLRDTDGRNRAHPKIYVGFFKHAEFFAKNTKVEVYNALDMNSEYRSDDWYFMGSLKSGDFVPANTLCKYGPGLSMISIWILGVTDRYSDG